MAQLTRAERAYLAKGNVRPEGKLPIFDDEGQQINLKTIQSCLSKGLAEPWFANPLRPTWLICRLTEKGRRSL